MKPFFVTGFPRSRTAWLAVWLTTDRTICYHDPMGVTLEELQARNPGKRVGISGPETCLMWEEHQDAPWLVVRREQQAALDAFLPICTQYLPSVSVWEVRKLFDARLTQLNRMRGPQVLRVEYEELNMEHWARQVWAHLMPDQPFDVERWRMLNRLNIQQNLAALCRAQPQAKAA